MSSARRMTDHELLHLQILGPESELVKARLNVSDVRRLLALLKARDHDFTSLAADECQSEKERAQAFRDLRVCIARREKVEAYLQEREANVRGVR